MISIGALILLGACATKPPTDTNANSDANSATGTSRDSIDPAVLPPTRPAPSNEANANTYGTNPNINRAYIGVAIATLGDRVFFATDQYSLSEDARQILGRQAAWMAANPNKRVIIAGNCDERGTREYNLALGARRANSVKDYLISLGVAPNRIDTVSYGKERPIDDRPNEDGWAINRNGQTIPLN